MIASKMNDFIELLTPLKKNCNITEPTAVVHANINDSN
jgi:hypothetical protein